MGNLLIDLLALVLALVAFVALFGALHRKGSPYDEIGEGGTSVHEDIEALGDEERELAERAARELEIRQMLQARSERQQRQGKPPLDVEAETARRLAEP